MTPEPADIMIVSAHPDDAEFGVGGSVAEWIKEGNSVVYVICTNGDKGSSNPDIDSAQLARIREAEQKAAAGVLGVREVVFLGYPDQTLEDTPEFRRAVSRQIRLYRPEIVVTSDPYRRYLWHRDHRMAGLVTMDAVYPFARDRLAYPDLLAEGIMPHKVREVWFWGAEEINHRVDIADSFEIKLQALAAHESQIKEAGWSKVRQWLESAARKTAEGTAYTMAEGFYRVTAPE